MNTESVRWEMVQGIRRAFAAYRTAFRDRTDRALRATLGAVEAAHRLRQRCDEDIRPRLAALRDAERTLALPPEAGPEADP